MDDCNAVIINGRRLLWFEPVVSFAYRTAGFPTSTNGLGGDGTNPGIDSRARDNGKSLQLVGSAIAAGFAASSAVARIELLLE